MKNDCPHEKNYQNKKSFTNHRRWCENKMLSINKGSKNGMWKGEQVGYWALHEWVRDHKPKPLSCEICGKIKKLEIANISQQYKRDLNDWEWLCRRCHMRKDGRIEKLCQILRGDRSVWKKREVNMRGEKNPMFGKKHSIETRNKISMALKGTTPWNKGLVLK